MDLVHLKYFQTVAELQNITQAAERLCIAQPALSKVISNVERDVGAPLFERTSNRIRLNASGNIYLRRVQRALKELDDGKTEITGQDSGVINLGVSVAGLIAWTLEEYMESRPNLHICQQVMDSEQIGIALQQGKLDMGITMQQLNMPDIDWTGVSDDPLIALVSKQHPLARNNSLPLISFAEERFVLGTSGLSARTNIEQVCLKAGFSPVIIYEGNESELIFRLVEHNRAVTLISETLYKLQCYRRSEFFPFSEIQLIHITEPKCINHLGIATLRGHYLTPTVNNFIQMLFKQGFLPKS